MLSPHSASLLIHPFQRSWQARNCLSRLQRVRGSRPFLSLGLVASSGSQDLWSKLRNRLDGTDGRSLDVGHPSRRGTDVLILANIAFFIVQVLTRGRLLAWGMKSNTAISSGEWWRFITPAFLHSGIIHVAINCYSLKNLGPFMERLSNSKRFMATYAAGGIGCTILSYFCTPSNSVGASGAIYGLIGAQAVFVARHRKQLGRRQADRAFRQMAFILVLNFMLTTGHLVDHWGHIGGFMGGAVAAGLLGPCWQASKGRYLDRPPWSLLADKPVSVPR